MNEKVKRIHPALKTRWMPTSLFQLFVLNYFFVNEEFREFVKSLGSECGYGDKNDRRLHHEAIGLNLDADVVKVLSNPTSSYSDLISLYNKINQHEKLCTFFLKVNDAFCRAYSPDLQEALLKQIPCDKKVWQANHFPFLYNSAGEENVEHLLRLFSDHKEIMRKVIAEEQKAHDEGKYLIYRGAEVVFYKTKSDKTLPLLFLPVTGERAGERFALGKASSSFSLSYANSFFGGVFISTDACAARYSQPTEEHYTFHGWYAKINRTVSDHQGFLIRKDCTPEKLGAKLLQLAAESAIVIHMTVASPSINLANHHECGRELAEAN